MHAGQSDHWRDWSGLGVGARGSKMTNEVNPAGPHLECQTSSGESNKEFLKLSVCSVNPGIKVVKGGCWHGNGGSLPEIKSDASGTYSRSQMNISNRTGIVFLNGCFTGFDRASRAEPPHRVDIQTMTYKSNSTVEIYGSFVPHPQ